MKKTININIVNRKSRFEYSFIRTEISGIKLLGSEVKSIREGKVTLVDSYCYFNGNELFIKNVNIYSDGNTYSHTPLRDRKLLLKKKELKKLKEETNSGFSIIPYRLFFTDRGIVKIEIKVSKGKKQFDKRNSIKEKENKKEIKIFI